MKFILDISTPVTVSPVNTDIYEQFMAHMLSELGLPVIIITPIVISRAINNLIEPIMYERMKTILYKTILPLIHKLLLSTDEITVDIKYYSTNRLRLELR